MAAPLATPAQLEARVGEPIESDEERKLAAWALEESSSYVRHYGRNWLTPEAAPAVAVTITVAAAARLYLNPGLLDTERGDAITFDRDKQNSSGAILSPEEQSILRTYSPRRGGIISASLYNDVALETRSGYLESGHPQWRGYAYAYDGMKPFPLGVDPW